MGHGDESKEFVRARMTVSGRGKQLTGAQGTTASLSAWVFVRNVSDHVDDRRATIPITTESDKDEGYHRNHCGSRADSE